VVYVVSYYGKVYALKAKTGAKLWSYATDVVDLFLARRGEWGAN
jgi:outer membrane protein assembly factor BamB